MENISTSYIKRNGKLCIFPQPGGVKALIQLIIMNKKRKNNALNCENYNNFCMTKYENQIQVPGENWWPIKHVALFDLVHVKNHS